MLGLLPRRRIPAKPPKIKSESQCEVDKGTDGVQVRKTSDWGTSIEKTLTLLTFGFIGSI